MEQTRTFSFRGLFIWWLASLFFFYEFFLQVVLGTIAPTFMKDLHLSPTQFSIICAAYYIFYSLMQIPVGILADKFSIKKILSIATLVTSLGVFFLATSQGFFTAFLARLLTGSGSAFAFVCLLVLALNWFSEKHIGLLTGIAQFFGGLGPLIAGAPLTLLIALFHNDWRLVLLSIGFIGLALMVCIFLFVKDAPSVEEHQLIFIPRNISIRKSLLQLLSTKQIWSIICTGAFGYVSIPLIGAYWGTSYLLVRGLEKPIASLICSMIWLGYALGCPSFGKTSDAMGRRKPFIIFGAACGIGISLLLLYLPLQNAILLGILFFLLGFSASSALLSFPLISENVNEDIQGTAFGLTNTIGMAMAAIIPMLSTATMEIASRILGHSSGGHLYSLPVFTIGLSFIPVLFTIVLLNALFFLKETFCRSQTAVYKVNRIKYY